MVRCKHLDCQAYDDDGNFDGEYEDEQSLDVVEAYSCIKDISLSRWYDCKGPINFNLSFR